MAFGALRGAGLHGYFRRCDELWCFSMMRRSIWLKQGRRSRSRLFLFDMRSDDLGPWHYSAIPMMMYSWHLFPRGLWTSRSSFC